MLSATAIASAGGIRIQLPYRGLIPLQGIVRRFFDRCRTGEEAGSYVQICQGEEEGSYKHFRPPPIELDAPFYEPIYPGQDPTSPSYVPSPPHSAEGRSAPRWPLPSPSRPEIPFPMNAKVDVKGSPGCIRAIQHDERGYRYVVSLEKKKLVLWQGDLTPVRPSMTGENVTILAGPSAGRQAVAHAFFGEYVQVQIVDTNNHEDVLRADLTVMGGPPKPRVFCIRPDRRCSLDVFC